MSCLQIMVKSQRVAGQMRQRRLVDTLLRTVTGLHSSFHSSSDHMTLHVGDTASLKRTFTEQDVQQFVQLSGDDNPLHAVSGDSTSNEFGRPVVHGILTLGVLSAVMGTKLPGPGSVVVELNVSYPSPLYIGELLTASVEVTALRKRFVTLSLVCTSKQNKVVVKGSARLLQPKESPS